MFVFIYLHETRLRRMDTIRVFSSADILPIYIEF